MFKIRVGNRYYQCKKRCFRWFLSLSNCRNMLARGRKMLARESEMLARYHKMRVI